jgi:hypothetical protein
MACSPWRLANCLAISAPIPSEAPVMMMFGMSETPPERIRQIDKEFRPLIQQEYPRQHSDGGQRQ